MKRYRHNILVVDDERPNLESLRRTFRREYNVFAANSGDEALSIVQQEDIALIITDQRMPGMTGIELLERTMETYPHAIRIILTAFMDVEALIGAINAGRVYRYITKPWDPEELRITVRRAKEFFDERLRRKEGESFWRLVRRKGYIKDLATWVFSKLYDVLCSYGERPAKALVVSLIWIGLNGLTYFLSEVDFVQGKDLARNLVLDGLWDYVGAFGHWLCFSTAVFSGAEYGPWPQGWAAPLFALEPVAGIVLFSIFLATLARKMIRDD